MAIPTNESVSKWAALWEAAKDPVGKEPSLDSHGEPYSTTNLFAIQTKALIEALLTTQDKSLLEWAWSPEQRWPLPVRIIRKILEETDHQTNPAAFHLAFNFLKEKFPSVPDDPSLAIKTLDALAEPYAKDAAYQLPTDSPLTEAERNTKDRAARYHFLMGLAHPSNS